MPKKADGPPPPEEGRVGGKWADFVAPAADDPGTWYTHEFRHPVEAIGARQALTRNPKGIYSKQWEFRIAGNALWFRKKVSYFPRKN